MENRNSKVEKRYLDIEFQVLMLKGWTDKTGRTTRTPNFEFRFSMSPLW